MAWLTSGIQNLVLLVALAGSFVGAVYMWFKDKFRDYKTNKKVRKFRDDAEIAASPPKSKRDLIDWLRNSK